MTPKLSHPRRPQVVRHQAGGKVVLDHVSLDVGEHEVVCLIGASGSGKSTLLRCINLLEPIDDGAILLDGVDISEPGLDADPIRRRIGMVFQSYNLFPAHERAAEHHARPHQGAEARTRPSAATTPSSCSAVSGSPTRPRPTPTSCRAASSNAWPSCARWRCEPELMLLDEVTAALDPVLVGEVLNVIRDMRAEGMTMVLATHEMGFAREISDTVCFLKDGVILESGPPEQLFTAPDATGDTRLPRARHRQRPPVDPVARRPGVTVRRRRPRWDASSRCPAGPRHTAG